MSVIARPAENASAGALTDAERGGVVPNTARITARRSARTNGFADFTANPFRETENILPAATPVNRAGQEAFGTVNRRYYAHSR
ncbi:hypothetical protein [Novosphingobium sp. PhB165]|uniref:hypothetical protein n=1 Tax=Novosphingobium sp. PhB165 TaxID=2485105 RepID=UPI001404F1DC|nr:hypothetical protein [Novosphingobium sp. PhB165]